MRSKYLPFILEIVWIIVGVVSTLAGINHIRAGNTKIAITFFIIAFVSFAFSRLRHLQRKKM